MNEEWKPVPNFEGLYEVSNLGRVRSVERKVRSNQRNNHFFAVKQRFLLPDISAAYYRVTLSKDGKTKRFSVHRLVCEAFLENPENKPFVNHKDGDKLNNTLSNLEWVTQSENCIHALETGLAKPVKGERHGMAKYSEETVNEIRMLYETTSMTHQSIADKFGIDRRYITELINGKIWTELKVNSKKPRKFPLGENHSNSKITSEIAREIKTLLASGNPASKIADSLAISRDIVYDIKRGKTWKHISIYD